MFVFTLENGKKQFVSGLLYFILAVVNGATLAIALPFAKNINWIIAISVIFGFLTTVFLILSFIKIIFGAVVYHAERTSARDEMIIIKDNSSTNKSRSNTKNIYDKETALGDRSPIEKIIYYKKANAASIVLKDGHSFRLWNVKDDIAKWQHLPDHEFTELFYKKLIAKAELVK